MAVLAFREGGGHLSGEVHLGLALHLDGVLGKVEGCDHILFGDLLHLAFHHHNVVHRSGDNHIDVGAFHILDGGVDDEFAIDAAHADLGDGAFERDVGDCDSGRGSETSQTVGQLVLVARNQRHDDLRLGVEVSGEKGADGAVNQTGDENLILGGTSLAAEETSRDAAQGTVFFLVFNLEGHKVGTLHGFFLAANGGKNHRVAHSDDGGAIGLFGQLAGFDGHNAAIT